LKALKLLAAGEDARLYAGADARRYELDRNPPAHRPEGVSAIQIANSIAATGSVKVFEPAQA